MRPTRVVVESRSGGNSIRFFVRQGGVWQQWPRSSVTRRLVDLHWEIRSPLPPPDPAERRGVIIGDRWHFTDGKVAPLGDLPAPIKRRPEMWAYRHAEAHLMEVIAEAIGFPYPEPAVVKDMDRQALRFEMRAYRDMTVAPVPPGEARHEFISTFNLLRENQR